MLGGFILVWFVQIVAVFGVSLWGAELATPYSLNGGAAMTSKETGETLQTANADFCIVDGISMMRYADGSCPSAEEGNSMDSVAAEFVSEITSDLSDEFFAALMYVEIPSPNGNFLKVDVNGFVRNTADDSVRLLSSAGIMHVRQESYSCTDSSTTDYQVFVENGYEPDTYYHLDDTSDVVPASRLVRRLQNGQGPNGRSRPPLRSSQVGRPGGRQGSGQRGSCQQGGGQQGGGQQGGGQQGGRRTGRPAGH